MVRRLGLGKNNHLTYASLALNPRYIFDSYFMLLLVWLSSNEIPQHALEEERKLVIRIPILSGGVVPIKMFLFFFFFQRAF